MAQVVEYLPTKYKALSSNSSTAKRQTERHPALRANCQEYEDNGETSVPKELLGVTEKTQVIILVGRVCRGAVESPCRMPGKGNCKNKK
jgi:hypothetical protein